MRSFLSFGASASWATATRILFGALLLGSIAMPAALNAATFKITIRKQGDGLGTVSGNGVLCDPGCQSTSVNLNQGSSVTISGLAEGGSLFVGFMGDRCYGPQPCTLTMNANTTLYAAFGLPDTFDIRYSSPSNGDTGVTTSSQPTVFFNRDIVAGPDLANITLVDSEGTPVAFNPVVRSTDRRLVLVPSSSFAAGAIYTVDVPAEAVADTQGNLLTTPYTFAFRTAVPREPKMYIAAYPSSVMEGSETKVSIWFEKPADWERTITLTSTPEGELFHPSEVILPAGQVLTELQVDSRYNHGRTSPVTVTLSAAEPEAGQQSTQIVVANNTSVTGASLRWQAGSVVADTDHDGIFEAGESADMRFEVANLGPSTITNVILEFSVINTSGINILGGSPYTCNLGSIAAGRGTNCTKSFKADSELPTGDYYVQVKGTSSANSILDQALVHIVNNAQPDFVLNAGSFPSSELLPNSTVDLRYTARNNGDGFSERLPLFEVTLEVQGTQQLLYQTYANVRGDTLHEQSFRLPLRVPAVPGAHTIRARINPPAADRLPESNYANNDAAVLTLRVATVYTLTVMKSGTGFGTVTSLPNGIDCGPTCSSDYASGKVVTLTASPDEGTAFTGWSGSGCTGTGSCTITMDAAKSVTATFEEAGPPGIDFYTITPCRVLDTRSSGPVLASGVIRIVPITGLCGIPADAAAVSVNVTAIAPSSNGNIALFPGNEPVPATSSINFTGGLTRANNAVLSLATDSSGTLAARATLGDGGQVDLVIDVNGFFK